MHAKSIGAQEIRALLVAQAASWATYRRGIEYPRDFAWLWAEGWPSDAKEFRSADPRVGCGSGNMAMLSARPALKAEYGRLHKAVLAIVRDDAVCRRLMTVLAGVGPLVAITYKSAIDDPHRIVKSKARAVRAHAKEISIGRRTSRRNHAGRRRDSTHGAI